MKADIIKMMNTLSHRHDAWRVFSDFVEMAAVSIANACDKWHPDHEKREARYMEIIKAYTPDELQNFAKMFAMLTNELEAGLTDALGQTFMEMDLGSKWHGQFFTPYSLCQGMAKMMIGPDDMAEKIKQQGFITVHEPAAGGGAMLIAFAEEMQLRGVNFQQHLHVTAQDLDLKAVHMCYVQLSLMGIPGKVIHGNTLLNESRSVWYTPMHIMGGWNMRLRVRDNGHIVQRIETKEEMQAPQITVTPTEIQGSLF
jgi:hypothetical protein